MHETLPIYSDDIKRAYSTVLEPLNFESGRTVTGCDEYLEAMQSSEVLAVSSERLVEQHYQACEALKRLLKAHEQGAEVKRLVSEGEKISSGLCSQLDLSTFSHSLRPQMQEGVVTLNELLKTKPSNTPTCLYVDESMRFELRPVLQFREEGAGEQYLIVWLTDEIKNGSYLDYQSLLVKMSDERSWLVLDSWPRPI
ncbi:MAG: hypothetical protein ACK5Q1_05925 [Limnobacter sp.]